MQIRRSGYSFLILFLAAVFFGKAQPSCTNIQMTINWQKYQVQPAGDSVFVKLIEFDLTDTAGVAKISYSITNLKNNSQLQRDYVFNNVNEEDMTVSKNRHRLRQHMKVSLGYFPYEETSYLVNLKLYDAGNNLLSSTNYNFSH